MVVAVMTTLVLFGGGPISAASFAQQQTTSPGFSIRWVNPDSETSEEISGKDDDPGAGTDASYHLVAWVNQVPTGDSVIFQYQSGSNTPVTIGTAQRVGTSDTYELFWSSFPADGTYTLIAVLFSNGNEVSRDTQSARVNNTTETEQPVDDPATNQAETVEIVEPTNVDMLGFYDPPGDARASAGIQVRYSADADNIRAYYSTTPPGTEPQWTACGTESASDAADGVRCTLASGVSSSQVTAVAAVATDNPFAPFPGDPDIDSADAHRVTGYDADPTTVNITPPTINNQGAATCTAVITATVLDQNGSRVVGHDVDVHAQGPDNTLAFDDDDSGSSATTSRSKAPENHPTEQARNCESTAAVPESGGTQGFHADGTANRKHIEALTGTQDNGTFRFRLYSTNTGTTQFTVWADEDLNDRYCSAEANSSGSIGWGQDAPAITGVGAEEQTCPRATGTASPTTASPTTASPTSPSPSPSTSSPTPGTSRTLTLAASRNKVTYGQRVTLSGQIVSSDPSCEDNEFVEITRRFFGQNNPQDFRSTTTDENGSFQVTFTAQRGADYQATTNAHDNCRNSASGLVPVQVKVKINISTNDKTPARGDRIRITVAVKPNHEGSRVVLQYKQGKRWRRVDAEELKNRSRTSFGVVASWNDRRDFRAKWKAQDDDHESNTSRVLRIRTR